MSFYMPDKTEISLEEFVEVYSDDYFLKNPEEKKLVPNLHRSSRYIEQEIETILRCGIKDGEEGKRDVARILAWKVDKICHIESEKQQTFVYDSDWKNAELLDGVKIRGGYPIDKAVTYIVENKSSLEQLAVNDPQGFLNELEYNEIFKGIGSVYGITLLYFLTHGKVYPIYDKYAMTALTAILGDVQPNEKGKENVEVKYKELPEKQSKRYSTIMSCEMKRYMDMLNKVFGDKWKSDRKYDQALWAYGHLFEPVLQKE